MAADLNVHFIVLGVFINWVIGYLFV